MRGWVYGFLLLTMLTSIAAAAPLTPEESQRLQAAQAAQAAGDHAVAVQALEALRAQHPDVADIHRLLGHSYAALGRDDEARQSLIQALTLGRLASDVLARLAELEQREQDAPGLISTLRLLVVLEPQNPQWRLALADALVAGGAYEEAALIYEDSMRAAPTAATALRLGNLALKQKQPEVALEHLELAWRLGDRTPSLPRTIADLAFSLQPRRAIEWYNRTQSLQPSAATHAALRKAELYLQLDDPEGAARELLVLPADAASAETHLLWGRVRLAQERVEDAVGHFQQARQSGRTDAQLLAYIAAFYFNQGDYAVAATHLRQRIDLGEASVELHRRLALALLESGQHAQARGAIIAIIAEFGLGAAHDLIERLPAQP